MIKAVIFDLDDTLIDYWKMKKASVEKAVDAMIRAGMKIPKELALKDIYGIYDKVGYEERFIFQKFLEKHGKIDYRIIAHGVVAYKEEWNRHLTPYPKVKETLKELKERGLKIGMITDAPKMKAYQRLVAMKIDELFDFVIAFEDTNRRKPHPLPFKIAIKMTGLKPEEMLMVGDWIERDVVGANSVGMKTCLAEYDSSEPYGKKTRTEKTKPDFRIRNFDEILKIV